jgi:hypothetical protein
MWRVLKRLLWQQYANRRWQYRLLQQQYADRRLQYRML